MARPCGFPVAVGAAVVALTAWVIALTLEGSPVALKNLRISTGQSAAGFDSQQRSEGEVRADLFVRGWTGFAGRVLGLGGRKRRRFLEARAGNRGGRGATTGPIGVSCTRMVNWKRGSKSTTAAADRSRDSRTGKQTEWRPFNKTYLRPPTGPKLVFAFSWRAAAYLSQTP